MKKILDVLLSPRFTSMYWRTGAMALTGILAFFGENIELFNLNPLVTLILGLAMGEITKALTDYTKGLPLGFSR